MAKFEIRIATDEGKDPIVIHVESHAYISFCRKKFRESRFQKATVRLECDPHNATLTVTNEGTELKTEL